MDIQYIILILNFTVAILVYMKEVDIFIYLNSLINKDYCKENHTLRNMSICTKSVINLPD